MGGPSKKERVTVEQLIEPARPAEEDDPSRLRQLRELWDANRQTAAALDPHMVLPMLQWMRRQPNCVYTPESLDRGVEQILGRTTWASAFEQLLGKPAPEAVQRRAQAAHAELERLNGPVASFTACLLAGSREGRAAGGGGGGAAAAGGGGGGQDRRSVAEWNAWWRARLSEEVAQLSAEAPAAELRRVQAAHAPFDASVLEGCLRLGRIFFDFGEYDMARKQLGMFIELACDWCTDARDKAALKAGAHWGLLATYLALWAQKRDSPDCASVESTPVVDQVFQLGRIPDLITATDSLIDVGARNALYKRTCLVHYAVYIVFLYYLPRHQLLLKAGPGPSGAAPTVPHASSWALLLDWLFSDRVISIIVGAAPHLLRYICVIAILNRRKDMLFRAAVDACARGGPSRDPLPAFLTALFVRYDFAEAQNHLLACSDAANSDFLLSGLTATLEEHSRLLIFETFCRIQKSISICSLAEKLHMTSETAERWIVDLIRHAGLEAKIDSEKARVEMSSSTVSVYQQIIETTRGFRLAYV